MAAVFGAAANVLAGSAAAPEAEYDISRFFTGNPTDKAIWMLLGGAVMVVVGLAGLFRGSNKST